MKQVIIIRKDLNMRKGKMIAQGAHASLNALLHRVSFHDDGSLIIIPKDEVTPALIEWINGEFKKICVSVDSEEELIALYNEARKLDILCSLVKDSGLTEFKEPTYTAVAIGPAEDNLIDSITKHLKLL